MGKGSGGSGRSKSKTGGGGGEVTVAGIAGDIRSAALSLAGGNVKQRVYLADLREKLPYSKADVDHVLKQMQSEGKLVLVGIDNFSERTKRHQDAAVDMVGNPRHLVYLQK